MQGINTDQGRIKIEGQPNQCPFCHKSISPNTIYGHKRNSIVEVLFYCPNENCYRSFLGYYENINAGGYWNFNGQVTQGVLVGREFTETITDISNSFSVTEKHWNF